MSGNRRELPIHDEGSGGLPRRQFLRLVGGGLALAALPSCRAPIERILPYIRQPPELIPGNPTWYATAMMLDGFATGLLLESREGRPVKVEGNPLHPASLGGTSPIHQASVLDLYDPDRMRQPLHQGRPVALDEVLNAFSPERWRASGNDGAGVRLLLPPTSSPTESRLLDRIREQLPRIGIHFHGPLVPAPFPLVIPQYDLTRARVIVAVDADFLGEGPFHLRYARQFAATRDPGSGMSRLYAIEPGVSITGAQADHRIAVTPSRIPALVDGILATVEHGAGPAAIPEWASLIAADLLANRGRSLVIADPALPGQVRAACDRLNQLLGNAGTTVWYTGSPLYGAGESGRDLNTLIEAISGGVVQTLICIGVNPCYGSPGELGLDERWARVPERLYAGTYSDETAEQCQWTIPLSHYLESWGDGCAVDGIPSVIQPLIRPLHGSLSAIEILAHLAGDSGSAHDLTRATWTARLGQPGFDEAWQQALSSGVMPVPPVPRVREPPGVRAPPVPAEGPAPAWEALITPDYAVHDGCFAHNGWLEELPRPITSLTWGNACHLSPASAASLGVESGDLLALSYRDRTLELPALVVPGVADRTLGLSLGSGRSAGSSVGEEVGADVYRIWPADRPRWIRGLTVRRTGARVRLALTQRHWDLEGRDVARLLTREEAARLPPQHDTPGATLYPPPQAKAGIPQWAMVIDLSRCTGCSACVVACQAENNVPVVGRPGVLDSREMHWLRIDQYRTGEDDASPRVMQPMLCQHCELAPCEYVCPVEATTHSPDGLNEMTYQRCVGTRFCSNNCPYKVRRFNWFDYHHDDSPLTQLVHNPHVTVRERGVMEKCTFCVQRIREAEIEAGRAGRPLQPSEVRTACQQACPSEAIRFGSLTDPGSGVAVQGSDPRAYAALGGLGTRPRVRYLARVRNPNPAWPG